MFWCIWCLLWLCNFGFFVIGWYMDDCCILIVKLNNGVDDFIKYCIGNF